MSQLNQIYKCAVCGKMVEILCCGKGDLTCCNNKMNLLQEDTEGVPKVNQVVFQTAKGNVLSLTIEHPMTDNHWIQWVEVIEDNRVLRKQLNPQDDPTSSFLITSPKYKIRAYCHPHGLWMVN